MCEIGSKKRYKEVTPEIKSRIDKELDLIQKKDFVTYFLINWDMLTYARSQGFYYVGRGSGANSVVAYLLEITDVDPIELDLYFERFINLYRENPPDFDIDFSWKDRDAIYAYLFNKYDNIALLSTYNTFQLKSTIREIGKVFGVPKHEIDQLVADKYKELKPDSLTSLVLKYAQYLNGRVSHFSIHAGGVLIANEPLSTFSSVFTPPKGLPTSHLDMHIAEDVGLYKFDILSQRGLGKIRDAVTLIKNNYPDIELLDLQNIHQLKKDKRTLETLKKGDAIGCFYVESPAMRMLFKKLKVRDYLGLVAASSIIRPGVAQSGMMQEYIKRYNSPTLPNDISPVMLDIMPETYGVMVYQEDVIKVAHIYAGLTLAESDVLRRGMSGKFRGREEFLRIKEKYFSNCKQKKYPKQEYEDIWRQIESFAGYAFSKGHSASYAVESFQALYLKSHFPLEYLLATVNNGGGFYSTEFYLQEMRKHGANIQPPCINTSNILSVLHSTDVYLGFSLIDSLNMSTINKIIEARTLSGPFLGIDDFLNRVHIDIDQLQKLITVDAFRFTGTNSKQLLLYVHQVIQKKRQPNLQLQFNNHKEIQLPNITITDLETAFDQFEYLGFFLCSPFELLKEKQYKNSISVENFPNFINSEITVFGYLITIKNTTTKNNERMHFGTFVDHKGDYIDTVHFPHSHTSNFTGKGIYKIKGYVREEFGYYTLEVTQLNRLPYIPDPRFT